jgi:hypothetical protein
MKHLAFLGAAMALGFSTPAMAQQITASVGADLSEGEFGTGVDTSILVVPLSLRASFDKFSFSVTVPYLQIDGASSVVGGGDGPIITDPNLATDKRSGIGDVNVRASYNAFELGAAAVTLHGRAKLPTGSTAKRLSTGEFDYSGGIEIAATEGTVQPFAEVGYRVLGDPTGVELKDGLYGSAGALVMLPGKFIAIANYDYVAASVDTVDDVHSLFGGLVIPAGDRLSVTTYGTAGLSNSAADWGAGVLLSLNFGR